MFTYNEGWQRSLLSFAEQHPGNCWFKSQNNEGGMIFEIDKVRLSIRITASYKEKRRKASGKGKLVPDIIKASLSQNGKNKVHRCLVIS